MEKIIAFGLILVASATVYLSFFDQGRIFVG